MDSRELTLIRARAGRITYNLAISIWHNGHPYSRHVYPSSLLPPHPRSRVHDKARRPRQRARSAFGCVRLSESLTKALLIGLAWLVIYDSELWYQLVFFATKVNLDAQSSILTLASRVSHLTPPGPLKSYAPPYITDDNPNI